nr:ABC transporter permease subunit [Pyrobaculum aerophilum]
MALLALLATFGRMAIALLITIAVAYAVAYAMHKSRRVESFVLPVLDVLQSVPILGFFPIALYVFIYLFPVVGAELAAIFLIFTSMAWNIIFSVYQSFKTMPSEYVDMARIYLNERLELAHVYIPAALRGIYYNIPVSWANAFFFITASEVITLGTEIRLFGIGSLVVEAFNAGDYATAYIGIAAGALANSLLYLTLWRKLAREVPQPPNSLAESLSAWLKYGWYVVVALTALFITAVGYYVAKAPPVPPPAGGVPPRSGRVSRGASALSFTSSCSFGYQRGGRAGGFILCCKKAGLGNCHSAGDVAFILHTGSVFIPTPRRCGEGGALGNFASNARGIDLLSA